jgi:hypothetical protein
MQAMAAHSRDDTYMRQRFIALHRTSAHYSKGRACTRFAHAALQLLMLRMNRTDPSWAQRTIDATAYSST